MRIRRRWPDVCAQFGFHPRPADVMLTLFVARGYVERDGDVFRVSAVGREHLTSGSPWFLGPYYGALKERPFVQDFARVLRTGQPANWGGAKSGQDWHVAMQDEAFARRFTAAMDCRGVYLGEALARAVDLSAHRRVLDIGGGSGIYACALAARHPHLRGDRARPGARRAHCTTLMAERGLPTASTSSLPISSASRCPAGYDVHLFSNVLHDWDAPEVRHLLSASFASLAARRTRPHPRCLHQRRQDRADAGGRVLGAVDARLAGTLLRDVGVRGRCCMRRGSSIAVTRTPSPTAAS